MKKILIISLLLLPAVLRAQDTLFKLPVKEIMDLPVLQKEEETVTTASKKAESALAAPATMSVITAKEIEAFGAMNLGEILDRATSLYILGTYFNPYGIASVRGTTDIHYNVHVLLLLDGRPLREPYNTGFNTFFFKTFPLSVIEKIEIIRGAGSVLYGSNAYTGVINIISKKENRKTAVSANLRYGSFQTWQGELYLAQKIGKLSVQAAGQINQTEGWPFTARGESDMRLVNGQETAVNPPKTINMQNESKVYWIKAEYEGFRLHSYGGKNYFQNMNQIASWFNPIKVGEEETLFFTDLSYQKKWRNSEWQISLNHSRIERSDLIESQTNPARSIAYADNFLAETSLAYQFGEKLNVLGGITFMNLFARNIAPSRLPNGQGFNLFGDKTNDTPYKTIDNESENWYTGYFQVDYELTDFLKIDLGGQFNKTAAPGIDFVPRLNLVFDWQKKFYAKLMYGQAFRSPSLPERYNSAKVVHSDFRPAFTGGGIDITPEKIQTGEVQLIYNHKGLQFRATYFNSLQKDLLVRSLPSDSLTVATDGNVGQKLPVPKTINQGELASQGIELESKISVLKNLYFTGSFSWFKVGDGTAEQQSMGMPNTMLKTGLAYENNRLGLTAGLFNSCFGAGDDINSRYKTANPQATAYNSLSVNLSLNTRKLYGGASRMPDIVLNIYGTNLLNEEIYYPEYARRIVNSLPGRPGRAFYVSLQYNFGR